jgi:hypothetical protein
MNKTGEKLTLENLNSAFNARVVMMKERQALLARAVAECPGAIEALLKKRFLSSDFPVIPEGNPTMAADCFEDLVTYFFLRFDDAGVLRRSGGGQTAMWNVSQKKWQVSRSDY